MGCERLSLEKHLMESSCKIVNSIGLISEK